MRGGRAPSSRPARASTCFGTVSERGSSRAIYCAPVRKALLRAHAPLPALSSRTFYCTWRRHRRLRLRGLCARERAASRQQHVCVPAGVLVHQAGLAPRRGAAGHRRHRVPSNRCGAGCSGGQCGPRLGLAGLHHCSSQHSGGNARAGVVDGAVCAEGCQLVSWLGPWCRAAASCQHWLQMQCHHRPRPVP